MSQLDNDTTSHNALWSACQGGKHDCSLLQPVSKHMPAFSGIALTLTLYAKQCSTMQAVARVPYAMANCRVHRHANTNFGSLCKYGINGCNKQLPMC